MNHTLLTETYVFILTAIALLICIVCYYAKRQKGFETFYQQELLRARLEIQEQTFKRVAQEIHDHIGQILSLAKLNLNRVNGLDSMKDEQMLSETKSLIGQSIKDLRTLSKTLNAETIQVIGLIKAIEIELQLVQNAGIKTVNLKVEGIAVRLDSEKELILYRIFQDATHYFIEHDGISFIEVIAKYSKESFEITIAGNGVALDHARQSSQGNDWQLIRTRAKLIGATFKIACTAETGTTFHIYLPLID